MCTREPELLRVLPRSGRPEVLPELAPSLVNRNRMSANLNVRVMHRVRQIQWIVDPSHGADRIPYAQKVRPALARKCLLEALRYLERMFIADFVFEFPNCVRYQRVVAFVHEAEHVEECGQCACGVSATAEAKQKELVTLLILIHEEDIGIGEVVHQASAERQPLHLGPEAS